MVRKGFEVFSEPSSYYHREEKRAMKIVIDIPEDEYELVRHENKSYRTELVLMNAVAEGTPLPKGHGDLIDRKYLIEDFKASKKISFAERMDISCIVDHAPIIIEADKAESEDKE